MAEISKITIPNGNTYDFKDQKAHYYGECSTAAATAAKEVSILNFTTSELVSGTTIRVKFTNNNTIASPTLNINSLGAKPIYRYGTTAPSTSAATSWQAGSIVALTYDGTGWILNGWLNDNTTYTVFDSIAHANGSFIANSAIYRYQLLFHIDQDTVTPLNNVSNGYNNTNKAILTNVEFDPFGEIYYYTTTTTVAANANIAATYLSFSRGAVDLRYSLNISASVNALTEHKDVYMKVSPQPDGKVKLSSAFPLVQTLPTTNDGYWYIFLGRAYSTYQMSLYPHHEVYKHTGSKLVQILSQDAVATQTTAGLMSASDKTKLDAMPTTNGLETSYVTLTDGSQITITRFGYICMLTGYITTGATMAAWSTIGTVTARFRPAKDVYFENSLGGGSLRVGFSLSTAGAIQNTADIPSGFQIWMTVTYIASDRS